MRKTMFAVLLLVLVAIVTVNCGSTNESRQAVLKLSTSGTFTIGAIDTTV